MESEKSTPRSVDCTSTRWQCRRRLADRGGVSHPRPSHALRPGRCAAPSALSRDIGDPPAPVWCRGIFFPGGGARRRQERDQLGGLLAGGAATTVATPPSLKHPKRRRHRNNVHFSGHRRNVSRLRPKCGQQGTSLAVPRLARSFYWPSWKSGFHCCCCRCISDCCRLRILKFTD